MEMEHFDKYSMHKRVFVGDDERRCRRPLQMLWSAQQTHRFIIIIIIIITRVEIDLWMFCSFFKL